MATSGAPMSARQETAELGVREDTARNWSGPGYLHAYFLPSGHRRLSAAESNRLVGEVFAVPASIEGGRPAAAPNAQDCESDFEGRLPSRPDGAQPPRSCRTRDLRERPGGNVKSIWPHCDNLIWPHPGGC